MKLFPSVALSQKAIAGIVVGVLGVGAAVGTFASQDILFQSTDDEFAALESTETPEATETAEATPTATAEPTDTPEATATPEATETPEPTPEADDDGDDGRGSREIKGIPDEDSPACENHDGCEVVQTPGCTEVRVPSVAADHERGKEGHGKDCDADDADEEDDGDEDGDDDDDEDEEEEEED